MVSEPVLETSAYSRRGDATGPAVSSFAASKKKKKSLTFFFSFFMNIALSLFSLLYYDLYDSVPLFVSFVPMFGLLYENQRQTISVYLLTQNQKNLLEENERLAAETHANELRHMIGNVAHDLKTVRNSFKMYCCPSDSVVRSL